MLQYLGLPSQETSSRAYSERFYWPPAFSTPSAHRQALGLLALGICCETPMSTLSSVFNRHATCVYKPPATENEPNDQTTPGGTWSAALILLG